LRIRNIPWLEIIAQHPGNKTKTLFGD